LGASDPDTPPAYSPAPAGKSRLLAVLLQCLPLLFTGSCLASTFGPPAWYLDAPGDWITSLFGLFILAWGFGYVYLRQGRRFVRALCSGLVLALFAWWSNIVLLDGCIDLGTTQQCPQRVRIFDRPFAVLTAAAIGFWVVLYARDAFAVATALGRGRSAEQTGRRSFLGRIALTSAAIGIAVLAFYASAYCNRLWESTR
jgi:hypothetical protein